MKGALVCSRCPRSGLSGEATSGPGPLEAALARAGAGLRVQCSTAAPLPLGWACGRRLAGQCRGRRAELAAGWPRFSPQGTWKKSLPPPAAPGPPPHAAPAPAAPTPARPSPPWRHSPCSKARGAGWLPAPPPARGCAACGCSANAPTLGPPPGLPGGDPAVPEPAGRTGSPCLVDPDGALPGLCGQGRGGHSRGPRFPGAPARLPACALWSRQAPPLRLPPGRQADLVQRGCVLLSSRGT